MTDFFKQNGAAIITALSTLIGVIIVPFINGIKFFFEQHEKKTNDKKLFFENIAELFSTIQIFLGYYQYRENYLEKLDKLTEKAYLQKYHCVSLSINTYDNNISGKINMLVNDSVELVFKKLPKKFEFTSLGIENEIEETAKKIDSNFESISKICKS